MTIMSPEEIRQHDLQSLMISDIRIEARIEQDPRNPGKMRTVEWASWRNAGDPYGATTSRPIAKLRPSAKNPLGSVEWPKIEPKYEAWKRNQAAPVDGTPLDAWNGLSASEAQHLQMDLAVFTLEDFARMGEGALNRCKVPNARERQRRAKMFLDAQARSSDVQSLLAERDAREAEKDARIAQMEAALRQLSERIEDKSDKAEGATKAAGRAKAA